MSGRSADMLRQSEHAIPWELGLQRSSMWPERRYNMDMSEELTGMKRFFGPGYYGEQDENGIDLSLIRENLKLTALERIRKGDAARRQALLLLEYGRRHRKNAVRANR